MIQVLPRHGGQLHAIAKSFGLDESRLLDFSANINPDGPPVSVLTAIQQYLLSPGALTTYPDMEELALREAIAIYAGCKPGNILVGNGFVALLEAVVQAKAFRSCCVPVPAFNEYRRTLERCGVVMKPLLLHSKLNFAYSVSEMLASGCNAILLANPQNPSGVLTRREVLIDLVDKAEARGILVLLDEAFIDYAPAESLTADVATHPNLVVFRSVTKYFGMPGLRVAYAVAHATSQAAIVSCMAPWSISTPASVGVIAALRDKAFQTAAVVQNANRRKSFTEVMRMLKIMVYPGMANYLLVRLPPGMDAHQVWRQMAEIHGIILRLCDNFEGLPNGHLRTAIGSEELNSEVARALATSLQNAPTLVGDDGRVNHTSSL